MNLLAQNISRLNSIFYALIVPFLTLGWLGCAEQKKTEQPVSKHLELQGIQTIAGPPAYYPRFAANGDMLIGTAQNQAGLFLINLQDGTQRMLNEYNGAGASFFYHAASNTVVFRKDELNRKRRRVYALVVQNLDTGSETVIAGPTRNLSQPLSLKGDQLCFLEEGNVKMYDLVKNQLVEKAGPDFNVFYLQNDAVVRFDGNKSEEWQPFTEGRLLWLNAHPTKLMVLVYESGTGLHAGNWQDRTTEYIGAFRAAVFSPDGTYIAYMIDEDDGQRITGSDIYVRQTDSGKVIPVTATNDQIEMFPQWSPDGTKLAFHTLEGQIKIATFSHKKGE